MAGCAARAPPGSEARLSLATFLLGASVLALPLLTRAGLQGRTGLALYVAGLNALLLLLYRPPRYQVRAGGGRWGLWGGRGSAWRGAWAPFSPGPQQPPTRALFTHEFRSQEGTLSLRARAPCTRRVGVKLQLVQLSWCAWGGSERARECFYVT